MNSSRLKETTEYNCIPGPEGLAGTLKFVASWSEVWVAWESRCLRLGFDEVSCRRLCPQPVKSVPAPELHCVRTTSQSMPILQVCPGRNDIDHYRWQEEHSLTFESHKPRVWPQSWDILWVWQTPWATVSFVLSPPLSREAAEWVLHSNHQQWSRHPHSAKRC